MIDFKNASFTKLTPISIQEGLLEVAPLITETEEIFAVYLSLRDKIIFTNKRVIIVTAQGITGAKKEGTSLYYKNILAFTVAGQGSANGTLANSIEKDLELEILFAGTGRARFEFCGEFYIRHFSKCVANYLE